MYQPNAPGQSRGGGRNPPLNVPPPQLRSNPNPSSIVPMQGGTNPPHSGNAPPNSRIAEMLDQIKAEYEQAIQQLNLAKMVEMELERKFQAQVAEMNQMQKSFSKLDAAHRQMQQQYEEEVIRLRRQMEAMGGQVQNSGSTSGAIMGTGGQIQKKRHRSTPSVGSAEDPLMNVVNAAAQSSRAGTGSNSQRGHSPVRGGPVPPIGRLPQPLGGAPPAGPLPPPNVSGPQLNPIETHDTPTNRNRPLPRIGGTGADRDDRLHEASANGDRKKNASPSRDRRDERGMENSSNRNQSSPPTAKKLKTNNAEAGTNVPTIPSLSNSANGKGPTHLPQMKIPRDQGSTESSPSNGVSAHASGNNGQSASARSSGSGNAGSTPTEGDSTAITTGSTGLSHPAKDNKKASKLNWNSVYSSRSMYSECERPVAEIHQSMDHQSVVCCVRFSSDGTMVASGCHKTAQVFDVQTGEGKFLVSRPERTAAAGGSQNSSPNEADDAYVRAVCFSPDCTKLVAGMPHHTIRVWDIKTNDEGPAMVGHESEIYSLDYVNDLIVSGSGDRKVRLWDARTSECKQIFGNESGGPSDGVTSVALSPDGHLLAAASLDKVVRIWDTETGSILDRFEGHSDSVYSIAFSPDGKNVISGSLDRSIMLWEVGSAGAGRTTTRPRLVFQGHKDFVLSVAYTPDGRWLMSGSKDRSVVFWDARASRSVLTLTGYRNSVISVASSPATPYFATGSGDCFAVVWKYQCQTF